MRLNDKISVRGLFYLGFLCTVMLFSATAGYAQSIDETYKQALKEGGTLNVYGTLTPDTAQKVLPVFEKRFPGMKTVNTGASSDKIVARAISEARGGRTIGDVFHMNLENVMQVHEQGLVLDKLPPEATFSRVISRAVSGSPRDSTLWWRRGIRNSLRNRTSRKASKSSPSRNGRGSYWPSRAMPSF